MKYLRNLLATVTLITSISGCVSSVVFDVSGSPDLSTNSFALNDHRKVKRDSTEGSGGMLLVGDKYLAPSPIAVLSSKFSTALQRVNNSEIKEANLEEFTLLIYYPKHGAMLSSAALAGGLASLGIIYIQNDVEKLAHNDGVYVSSKIGALENSYTCSVYVEAYDQISALVGPMVNEKELEPVINDALNRCVDQIVEKISR